MRCATGVSKQNQGTGISFNLNRQKKRFPAHCRPVAPDRSLLKYPSVFEHLAYAVCGIGNAAGNAGDEALLLPRLCLGGRFRLCRFLLLFLGDGIAVFHLIIAVAILGTLALLVVFCHNYHVIRLCQN